MPKTSSKKRKLEITPRRSTRVRKECEQSFELLNLPYDTIVIIISKVNVKDLVNLSQTCGLLYAMINGKTTNQQKSQRFETVSNSLWKNVYERNRRKFESKTLPEVDQVKDFKVTVMNLRHLQCRNCDSYRNDWRVVFKRYCLECVLSNKEKFKMINTSDAKNKYKGVDFKLAPCERMNTGSGKAIYVYLESDLQRLEKSKK